jgi:hypothetical protein
MITDNHSFGVLSCLQRHLGAPSCCGAYFGYLELGDWTETFLSFLQGPLLLWVSEAKERIENGLDKDKRLSCGHHILPACSPRCFCFQTKTLVLPDCKCILICDSISKLILHTAQLDCSHANSLIAAWWGSKYQEFSVSAMADIDRLQYPTQTASIWNAPSEYANGYV